MLKTLGVINKPGTLDGWQLTSEVVSFCNKNEVEILLDRETCKGFPLTDLNASYALRPEMAEHADVVMVIGGDGTFLGAARDIIDKPIIGVNMGTLGFLTDVSKDNAIAFLQEVLENQYIVESRSILRATVTDENGDEIYSHLAFNDVVVSGEARGKMTNFSVYQDNRRINTQRSDGVIFATPTGSTAYSLSAGGPILSPELPLMTMVSINPHSLGNRPLVLSDESNVRIKPVKDCSLVATCDGASEQVISEGMVLQVRKSNKSVRIMHPSTYDYFEILRNKLGWGGSFI